MTARSGLAWMGLAQAAFFVLQFAGSVAVTRLLSPRELGVYAIASAIAGMLGVIQVSGLNRLIVREAVLSPALLATVQTVQGAAAILVSTIILLASLAARRLGEPGVVSCMTVLAAIPVIAAAGFLPAAMLERDGRFRAIALASMAQVLASVIVTVGLASAGASYLSVAYGALAGTAVRTAGHVIAGRHHICLRAGLQDWRRIVRYAWEMLAIAGVGDLSNRAGDFIVGRLLGLGALGLFSRASQLNSLMRDNIQLVIDRVLFVTMARSIRRGGSLRTPYLSAVEMVTALLWPVYGGVGVLAGPLVRLVYGDRWLGAATPLALLCLASAVQASLTMAWEVFVLCHETGRQARFEAARAVLRAGCVAAGCSYGLAGAAAARVADALFCQALYRPHLERMTKTSLADYLRIYRRAAVPACAAIGPAALVMAANGWSPYTPLPWIGASILAGVAAWALCLWRIGHPVAAEVQRLMAGLLRPTRIYRPN